MHQRVLIGSVEAYDSDAGLGVVVAGSGRWPFHCTAIADGSREIDPDTTVAFQVRPAGPGRWEAFGVARLEG